MKRTIHTAVLAAVILTACNENKPSHAPAPSSEPCEVKYATRAGGVAPDEGQTFTFISYNKNADGSFGPNMTTSTTTSDAAYHQKPAGYYAYLTDSKYDGILQPCDTDDAAGSITGKPYGYRARNVQKGQALYNGDFRTVCLTPAIPVTRISAIGSDRMLFGRNQPLYASAPFDIRVAGYEVFELDLEADPLTNPANDPALRQNRPLTEVRSKILVDFIQGSDYPFELEHLRLTNPGVWGWYQPLLQVTGVSYDSADEYNIYDKDTNRTAGNEVALTVSDDYPGTPADIYDYTAGATAKGDVLYTTGSLVSDGFFFFAADYTKNDLLQPGIAFDLMMNGSGFKITVPLTMNMQRGYAYRFRLTVESLVIRATFQAVEWETGQVVNSDILDNQEKIFGIWTPEGWTNTYNIAGDIGTPNY